jgi:outer membrane usher protein FimD/PapC
VTFALRSRPSLNLTLHGMDGQPLEVGSEVQLPDGRQALVGYDGLLYRKTCPPAACCTSPPAAGNAG